MKHKKHYVFLITGLILITACSSNKSLGTDELSNADSTISADFSEIYTTKENSTNTYLNNNSKADEIAITTAYGSFTVQDIIDILVSDEIFNKDFKQYSYYIKLADLNDDEMPEIIMQSAIYEFSFIYSFNRAGELIKLYDKQNQDEYFSGYDFKPYIKNGEKYYFAGFWGGGSQGGHGGICKIWMERDDITTEIIANISYNKISNTYTEYEYTYSFGDKENLTKEEYDLAFQEYISEYTKVDEVMVSAQFVHLDYEEKTETLEKLLKDYFTSKQIN